jgi:uncharacterized membrane protein
LKSGVKFPSPVKAKSCEKNSLKNRPPCTGIYANKMCKRNRSYMFTFETGLFRKGVVNMGFMFEIQQTDLMFLKLCTLLLMLLVWPGFQ